MLWVVDNPLSDHVGLPHVLDLAVHLVQLMTWMGRGSQTETFSLLELFPYSALSWLKVMGGWGVGGPCDYRVSFKSKSLYLYFLGTLLVLGLGFGLGLDKFPGTEDHPKSESQNIEVQ